MQAPERGRDEHPGGDPPERAGANDRIGQPREPGGHEQRTGHVDVPLGDAAAVTPTPTAPTTPRARSGNGSRRREELAGVGTTWYTWLEQGRDVRASLDVLEALARALRLTPAERVHLILLGRGEEAPACRAPAEQVSCHAAPGDREAGSQSSVRARAPLGLPRLQPRRVRPVRRSRLDPTSDP
ncbi:MAG: hypothetical protein DLM64_13435 [Solirubrobacterales bacterium]|nr:MAG: hypothetical protein DLM64_13435 [Solirubrobacterales bacterium]